VDPLIATAPACPGIARARMRDVGDAQRRQRLQHRELAQPLGRERAGEALVELARRVEA
jgi:hypothetical protein